MTNGDGESWVFNGLMTNSQISETKTEIHKIEMHKRKFLTHITHWHILKLKLVTDINGALPRACYFTHTIHTHTQKPIRVGALQIVERTFVEIMEQI